MRIAVLGDIHGNQVALEAVWDDLRRRGSDQVVILGDLSLKGPAPGEVLTLIRGRLRPEAVILGNTDHWLVTEVPAAVSKAGEAGARAQDLWAWTRERIGEDDRNYLESLAFAHRAPLGIERVLFVHSTPDSHEAWVPLSAAEEELARAYQDREATVIVYGHVHVPGLRRLAGGRTLVNAGSVGLPADGDPRASYALLEAQDGDVSVTLVRVPYDVEAAAEAALQVGMPWAEAYGAALRAGGTF